MYLRIGAFTHDPESEQTTELINVLDDARRLTLYVDEHSLINGLSSRAPPARTGSKPLYKELEILLFSPLTPA